jgi:tetraacyldisaccharide 4'-kinase
MAVERHVERALHAWVHGWWRGEAGMGGIVVNGALWPAEALYRLAITARNTAYDRGLLRAERANIPVISVGNLGVGGAGKTPVAAWLVARLRATGHAPAIVLRGYAEDEVKLHRELNPEVPVVVGKRRVTAVAEAAARRCDVAVVDDGFQHRAVARALDLVLVSADGWTPRRKLLPRGPWREPVGALRRAGMALVTRKAASREEADRVAAELVQAVPGLRVAVCRIHPSGLVPLHGGTLRPPRELSGMDVVAVASLADPAPFVANLRALGARVELLAYPDHHDFDRADAARITRIRGNRPLLMTHKDAVKLRDLLPPDAEALILEQHVEIEDGEALLDAAIRGALNG